MSCRLRTEIERDGDEGVRWQLHEQGLTRVGDLVEGLRRHRVQPLRRVAVGQLRRGQDARLHHLEAPAPEIDLHWLRGLRLHIGERDDAPTILGVYEELTQRFPWYENATGRLEIVNRVKLWRALTGNDAFDLDYWMIRVHNRPTRVAVGATSN